jgi:cytochrome c556
MRCFGSQGAAPLGSWQRGPACATIGAICEGKFRFGGCALETWRWKFSLAAATAVAAAVALMVSVHAEGTAPDVAGVVATRQAAMKALASNVKIISDYTEDKANQAAAVEAAKVIVSTAKTVPSLFPPGTGLEALPGKSGAKPEIWAKPAEFATDAAALVAATQALLDAVQSGDPAETRKRLVTAGKEGCGTCHSAFRVKI